MANTHSPKQMLKSICMHMDIWHGLLLHKSNILGVSTYTIYLSVHRSLKQSATSPFVRYLWFEPYFGIHLCASLWIDHCKCYPFRKEDILSAWEQVQNIHCWTPLKILGPYRRYWSRYLTTSCIHTIKWCK